MFPETLTEPFRYKTAEKSSKVAVVYIKKTEEFEQKYDLTKSNGALSST